MDKSIQINLKLNSQTTNSSNVRLNKYKHRNSKDKFKTEQKANPLNTERSIQLTNPGGSIENSYETSLFKVKFKNHQISTSNNIDNSLAADFDLPTISQNRLKMQASVYDPLLEQSQSVQFADLKLDLQLNNMIQSHEHNLNRINYSKFMKQKPVASQNSKLKEKYENSQHYSQSNTPVMISPRLDELNPIKVMKNNDRINKTSDRQNIEKQRNVINNMIANSRGTMPSLFKHEFYDETKQDELEKILQKKLQQNAILKKKGRKKYNTNQEQSCEKKASAILNLSQIPYLHLGKVTMKNIEMRNEQDKFSVLKNEYSEDNDNYPKSRKIQTQNNKDASLHRNNQYHQSPIINHKGDKFENSQQYSSNRQDNGEFISEVDQIMQDQKYLKGLREIKDFEFKMSQMDNQLDHQLSTIGETFDSNDRTIKEQDNKIKNIVKAQGRMSPKNRTRSPKRRTTDMKVKQKNHSPKNRIAFMQKVPLMKSSNDEFSQIMKEINFHGSFKIDQVGGMDIRSPQSKLSRKSRFREDERSASDYYQKLFQQTQGANSTKYEWNKNDYMGQVQNQQSVYDLVGNSEMPLSMVELKKMQQDQEAIEQAEIENIISQLLEANIESHKQNGFESRLSRSITNNFDDYASYEHAKDSKMNFFRQCQQELVLALPILNKIRSKTLYLQGYMLNIGHCKALSVAFRFFDSLMTRLHLENNNIKDEQFKDMLEGLNYVTDLKSIIYKSNEFGSKSLKMLKPLIAKSLPYHLEELRIINCKISSTTTDELLNCLYDRCFLRKLALVNANLQESGMKTLINYLQESRLTDLDISWNGLKPQSMVEFIQVIGLNRQLSYLNISWNSMLEKNGLTMDYGNAGGARRSQEGSKDGLFKAMQRQLKMKAHTNNKNDVQTNIMINISNFIKYNKNLLHIDLSNTGMTEDMLWNLGTAMRRSRSMVSMHLSGNPGSPRQEEIQEGVQLKQVFQHKKQAGMAIETEKIDSDNKKLIFQRFLGHKAEMPFSGQWQMLTEPLHDHCWVCDKWTYTLIFWSPNIGYFSSIEIDMLQREKILEQVREYNPDENRGASNNPSLYGSFTNWKKKELLKIEQFCQIIDKDPPDLYTILRRKKLIGKEFSTYEELPDQLKKQFDPELKDHIKNHYRKSFKEVIMKNSLYRRPYLVNGQFLERFSDRTQEQLYVYPCFIRAGKHSYIVKNTDDDYFLHKMIAPFREEDIPVYIKQSKMKVFSRVFKKETSVFRDWKEDNDQILARCCDHDYKYWKIPRFVKDPGEVCKSINHLIYLQQQKCFDYVIQNFTKLKEIFITIASRSSFPNISWIDFTTFCEQCKVLDKNVVLATIDRLFIATNVEIESTSDSPDKSLCRYEFFEILVRLANAKYKEPGIVATHSEAFRKILEEHILPNAFVHPWQEFRDKQIWTIEVSDTLEVNLDGLKKVYAKYFDPRKKYMSMQDGLNLMMRDTAVGLIEKDAIFCYGMCKMTCINEAVDSSKHYKILQFVELLEYICRVADYKFRNNDDMNLVQKIEIVLEDVLALVDVKRKDVNIKVDDESESDDDY
ncbi:UNKNOWN [Stylonychia lemnae]|uniref:Leucine Rich Repeat family protein n=1 Tax=Stylonychia lemnae TaxID=5949 RepID=A0A078B9A9_STYLE|nr:UNKNOWN [Stylonychia lemnae]|eukprot:CDW89852.1 UNKNOWN [Stylonychia lemnae]